MGLKLDYLRDRAFNAVKLVRQGQFRLIMANVFLELAIRSGMLVNTVFRRTGVDLFARSDSRYSNRRKVIPASYRPTKLTNPGVVELSQQTRQTLQEALVEILAALPQPGGEPLPEDGRNFPTARKRDDEQISEDVATRRYLEVRDQLRLTAKDSPEVLAESIRLSPFYLDGDYDNLYFALLSAAKILCEQHEVERSVAVLQQVAAVLPGIWGAVASRNFFSQLELQLGLRRIRIGIYDHAGHYTGGGQRYMAELAAQVQDSYEVTYIFNKEVSLDKYSEWYDLDLSACSSKVIPIPFFEERNLYAPNEIMVAHLRKNAYDVVAADTVNYDIFINTNMLGKVNPLSLQSVFICHFPDRYREQFFQVHKYDHVVISGEYARGWVQKRWKLDPTFKLYPPVNMYNADSSPKEKERLILSVSRFEATRSKKQLEMVRAFRDLCRSYPDESRGWTLVLAGGSTPDNAYLDLVRAEAEASGCNIEIKVNAPFAEIRDLYRRARIFWHACGLDETRPERVEHFGMTTVEAMQNYCVPIVINGGGQQEIVVEGVSGFRFNSVAQLCEHSVRVMGDDNLSEKIALGAFERSKLYNRDQFRESLGVLMDDLELSLLGEESP
jgi:glycosyltransferase involved in cell wall biosynthesis